MIWRRITEGAANTAISTIITITKDVWREEREIERERKRERERERENRERERENRERENN